MPVMNQPSHTTSSPGHRLLLLLLLLAGALGACDEPPVPGLLVFDRATHDFGQRHVGEIGAEQVFTVRNAGVGALDDLSVRLEPDASFAVMATTCAGRLEVGATCTITAAFTPAWAGEAGALLVVEADRADASAVLGGVGAVTVQVVNNVARDAIVESEPAGIRCGVICQATFTVSEIVLTVSDASGGVWSKACEVTPQNDCVLALSGDAEITLQGVLAPQWIAGGAQHVEVVTDAGDNVIVARYGSPALVKLSPAGALVWQKDDLDVGLAAAVDAQGNVAFGTILGLVVTLDGNGDVLWSRGGELTGLARIDGMAFDPSGALYLAGAPAMDEQGVRLLKLGRDGNELWSLTHAPGLDSYLTDLVVDGSGNVFISGSGRTGPDGGSPLLFVRKYDGDGGLLWERDDMGGALAVDGAGNLFVEDEPRLRKLAPDGSRVWDADIGSGVTGLQDLVATPAGDVILAGTRYADGVARRAWLARFDGADGTRRRPIELAGEVPFFGRVAVDGSGDVVIAGSNDGFGIQKYDGTLFGLPDE